MKLTTHDERRPKRRRGRLMRMADDGLFVARALSGLLGSYSLTAGAQGTS